MLLQHNLVTMGSTSWPNDKTVYFKYLILILKKQLANHWRYIIWEISHLKNGSSSIKKNEE